MSGATAGRYGKGTARSNARGFNPCGEILLEKVRVVRELK